MLWIALSGGLAIFLLLTALYFIFVGKRVDVNQRLGMKNAEKTKTVTYKRNDIWGDIANSQLKKIAGDLAAKFNDYLPNKRWFDYQVERADLPITGGELIVILGLTSMAWFCMLFLLGIDLTRNIMITVLWSLLLIFYVRFLGNKRMKAFGDQLGDAISMMSNALKAGFTFQQAMDLIAKEMPDPISGEFRKALQEIQLGVPIEVGLENLAKRVQNADFDLLVTAVVIQRQVGGNLSQIMNTIGETIRERIKLKGEIKSLTAEGVMSGWILGGMPIFMILMVKLINPNYFNPMLKSEFGKYIIGFAIVSEIIGGLIIKKLVNLKV